MKKSISVTSAILISKVQLCPTSSGSYGPFLAANFGLPGPIFCLDQNFHDRVVTIVSTLLSMAVVQFLNMYDMFLQFDEDITATVY